MPFPLLFASGGTPLGKPNPSGVLSQATLGKGLILCALPGCTPPSTAALITITLGTVTLSALFPVSFIFKRRGAPSWSSFKNSYIIFLPFLFPLPKITKWLSHSRNPKGVLPMPMAVLSLGTIYRGRKNKIDNNYWFKFYILNLPLCKGFLFFSHEIWSRVMLD